MEESHFMSAFITVFIALLGLLGLSVLNAERRKKEIGIRKVSGASVASLALGLTKELLIFILVAAIPAIPLASYVAESWLGVYTNIAALVILIVIVTVVSKPSNRHHSIPPIPFGMNK